MTTYIFRLPTAEPAIHQDLLALMTHKEFQRMSSVLYNMRRTITFVLFFFLRRVTAQNMVVGCMWIVKNTRLDVTCNKV